MSASDLRAATAVARIAQGETSIYRADLPDAWSFRTPSGGVLMTTALRAMTAELDDPAFHLVSATTTFVRSMPSGPQRIEVVTLRRGNAACQLRARAQVEGDELGLEVAATFARFREGPDAHGREMPEVPPPEACEDASPRGRYLGRTLPFFDNVELRLAIGAPTWRDDWEAGEARTAYWYRYLVPQEQGGELDPLALPPIIDTMPSSLTRRLGPKHARFFAPSLDLTVHFLDPSRGGWLLVDVTCPRARGGYASAHADVWDQEGHLLAFATQTMMLRKRRRLG
ncbi:MAG: thioesterase family protein [Myxococcales bacterium]|nr:thioesterase family protein [Myxococcales bacterium]